MTAQTESPILWFRDVGIKDRPSVGGKGASLGELENAGISVPTGFNVTTAAFTAYLDLLDAKHNIRSTIAGLDPEDFPEVQAQTAKIRELIESEPLSPELHEAIAGAYAEIEGDNPPVAVRSSATSEDSEEASFAGLQDTYLWVTGPEEVIRWVRTCWASLYSPESVNYRLRLGLPEEQLAMGVVVQRMVNSRCSGVMFTRSPTTGDRSVITIEGSWGLGSSIVSGEVTPDRFVVNKITGEITTRSIADKTVEHVPGDGRVDEREVDADRRNISSLTDEEIAALAETAKRVEQHYGSPQDIEWAIDHAGPEVLLLQSRPETVWATKDKAPVAKPATNAFDHIFKTLGGKK
jgi:pyruvate,water dikinase